MRPAHLHTSARLDLSHVSLHRPGPPQPAAVLRARPAQGGACALSLVRDPRTDVGSTQCVPGSHKTGVIVTVTACSGNMSRWPVPPHRQGNGAPGRRGDRQRLELGVRRAHVLPNVGHSPLCAVQGPPECVTSDPGRPSPQPLVARPSAHGTRARQACRRPPLSPRPVCDQLWPLVRSPTNALSLSLSLHVPTPFPFSFYFCSCFSP